MSLRNRADGITKRIAEIYDSLDGDLFRTLAVRLKDMRGEVHKLRERLHGYELVAEVMDVDNTDDEHLYKLFVDIAGRIQDESREIDEDQRAAIVEAAEAVLGATVPQGGLLRDELLRLLATYVTTTTMWGAEALHNKRRDELLCLLATEVTQKAGKTTPSRSKRLSRIKELSILVGSDQSQKL